MQLRCAVLCFAGTGLAGWLSQGPAHTPTVCCTLLLTCPPSLISLCPVSPPADAGFVHPNLNLDTPEEAVDLRIVVGKEKQAVEIDVALSNSFGFGGHNSCIMFRKYVE